MIHVMSLVAALTAVPVPGYGDSRAPAAWLELSYRANAGSAAVMLECDPVGGNHPHARPSCRALHAAGGDPDRIPPTLNACTMIYAPVVAQLRGTWHGTTIEWRTKFGNMCEMRRATGGALFDF